MEGWLPIHSVVYLLILHGEVNAGRIPPFTERGLAALG